MKIETRLCDNGSVGAYALRSRLFIALLSSRASRWLQKENCMLRKICNYFRECWCKHEFELLAQVTVDELLLGTSCHNTYRCKKCGFVQRVRL